MNICLNRFTYFTSVSLSGVEDLLCKCEIASEDTYTPLSLTMNIYLNRFTYSPSVSLGGVEYLLCKCEIVSEDTYTPLSAAMNIYLNVLLTLIIQSERSGRPIHCKITL